MSVEKLALRAHIFVGLEFESPLLETYFLVELVVVPGLSLSQPYLLPIVVAKWSASSLCMYFTPKPSTTSENAIFRVL
jgi:hypothetical protein